MQTYTLRLSLFFFFLVCFLEPKAYGLKLNLKPLELIEDIIEIKIPGVEDAYNASMIEYDDGYLMAFRYDTYVTPISENLEQYFQHIGLILLDENFQPKGPWQPCLGNRTYDPRLLKIDDTIYLIFASPAPTDPHSCFSSRLNLCTVNYSPNGTSVSNLNPLMAPFQQHWEKNWVLFDYKGKVLIEYTISPQMIIEPSISDGLCIDLFQTTQELLWPHGIIRGGTPALLIDGEYLGFFHSSNKDSKTKKYTYYIGAYTFSSEPPFALTKISRSPFTHKDFYSTPTNPLTSSQVVFPGGFVVKNNKIYLCYGENDGAIKIMVINKAALYKSLRKVKPVDTTK